MKRRDEKKNQENDGSARRDGNGAERAEEGKRKREKEGERKSDDTEKGPLLNRTGKAVARRCESAHDLPAGPTRTRSA